jgi:pimeloyl-ACP methyl ester carboxylesterase
MSERQEFSVPIADGALGGYRMGSGPPVLALHGGPGLSYGYLDGMVDELVEGFEVASFQQRGLAPSTLEGPFTIDQALEDVLAVLDGLAWPQALVVGHSWGGHLALRLLAAHPERLRGVLAVDPLGVVGDGGMAAFEAELQARTPRENRERAHELDQRAMAGQGTPAEAQESLEVFWPYYFADPDSAPPMPPLEMSIEAYSGLIGQAGQGLAEVGAAIAATDVPHGYVVGAASPLPWGQVSRAGAELAPGTFVDVVAGSGHFIWIEAPGRVRQALARLSA